MPHIILEYSDELDAAVREASLLREVRRAVVGSGLFAPEAVKARMVSYAAADVALEPGVKNFLHVTVAILGGRTEAQRAGLAEAVFGCAKALVPGVDKLSVEIREMEGGTYRK